MKCKRCGIPKGLIHTCPNYCYVGNVWLWLIVGAVLSAFLFYSFSAKADHTDVEFLEDKVLVVQGKCHITADIGGFWTPCELYVGEDDSKYIALYHDGKIQIVKRLNEDGSQTNVYERVQGQGI